MTATLHSRKRPGFDDTPPTRPSNPGAELTGHAAAGARFGLSRVLLVASTVLSGTFAGFFFTYSASVVLGLGRVDDLTYVRTFQAINDTIRNPAFAVVFFGSVPVTLAALLVNRHGSRARRLGLGFGAALLAAVVAITALGSIPLNNELATYTSLDTTTASIARSDFESTWNLLNLLRTVVSVAAATAIATALVAGGRRHDG